MQAGAETVDKLIREMDTMQDKLDTVSRNIYMQSEMDNEHAKSKF